MNAHDNAGHLCYFDERQWDSLFQAHREDIFHAIETNFGLKADSVHDLACKKAARIIWEIEQQSLDQIAFLLREIPMRADISHILIPCITIPETYFFRHREHFNWLTTSFLSELEARKRSIGKHEIRCWSAACGTGEEAYSIAIALREYFRDKGNWNIRVIATDINRRSLEIAKKGAYTEWSFRDIDSRIRAAYFSDCTSDHAVPRGMPRIKYSCIDTDVMDTVHFSEMNLTHFPWTASLVEDQLFDIIFCRNVMIYFSQSIAVSIASRCADHLVPDGALIVGPSESWFVRDSRLVLALKDNPTIFRRTSGLRQTASTQAPLNVHHVSVSKKGTHESSQKMSAMLNTKVTQKPDHPKQGGKSDIVEHRDSIISRVRACANAGSYEQAIAQLTLQIVKDPIDAELYYLRGLAFMNMKNFESADEDFMKSLFLEPDNIMAYISRASIAKERGKTDESRKYYSNALHFLSKINDTDVVPDSDGIPARIMRDMIESLMRQ